MTQADRPGIEVLVLHGSPGSGKTTLARAVSEILRNAEVPHAVIDLDDLDLVYPHRGRVFCRENLRAVWPNYTAAGPVKVVIPSVLADEQERRDLQAAVPGARFRVCELTAPKSVLLSRVTARESGEYWKARLRGFVELYHHRDDLAGIRDFLVSTHEASTGSGQRSAADAAREVVEKAGWA